MPHPPADRVAALLTGLAGRPAIETHFSEIYVGADTVWKRKKSVRLPFIDLTTLAARHHCLTRELTLNKPHAPGLYRDVVAIIWADDDVACVVEPGGAPPAGAQTIDWVLRMARVPEADLLDHRASRDALDTSMLTALGDMVAELHAALPPQSGWDSEGALERVLAGNAVAALEASLPAAEINAWRRKCEEVLVQMRPWLAARAAAGFVRRAHGDLHLGNICVWQGQVVAFDALEFDEALATIDTGYDLAFLLMDLDRRVGRQAANRVMNRYLARTGDMGLTAGLPLFLSLRAMVRAHVLCRSNPAQGEAYLAAAIGYLDAGEKTVVAIGGLPGTGKSTVARALAPGLGRAPGAVVVRSDEVRKRLHRVLPEQRLTAEAYSPEANARTNAALLDCVLRAASGGQAVIADATFLDPLQRDSITEACATAGLPFRGIWLEAPMDTLLARVRARQGDASDATEEVLLRAAERGVGEIGWTRVANSGR